MKKRASADGPVSSRAKGTASCFAPFQIEFIAGFIKVCCIAETAMAGSGPGNLQKARLTTDVRYQERTEVTPDEEAKATRQGSFLFVLGEKRLPLGEAVAAHRAVTDEGRYRPLGGIPA